MSQRKIRVAFVWPPGFLSAYSLPLPFAILKSQLDLDITEVRLFDCVLNHWNENSKELYLQLSNFQPDIVALSTWSPMFPESLAIFKKVKEQNPKCLTIIGGPHSSTYWKRTIECEPIDMILRGEAEFAFSRLIKNLYNDHKVENGVPGLVFKRNGEVISHPINYVDDLDEIAPPDFSFINLKEYNQLGYRWNSPPVNNAPLWITRGCPYRCQYCASPDLNGKVIRKHSIDYMIDHILDLYYNHDIRWFNIIDDNFTYDVKFAKEFCRRIIALNLPKLGFGTPNGIRMSRGDLELWSLMKQAGWKHLIVAPESGSQHTLDLMKKDLKLGIVEKKVSEIRKAGLKVHAFFIVGYPGETVADIKETFKLIIRCKFNFIFMANFHPLPGTPVYDQLVEEGKIPDGLLPQNFSDGLRSYTPENLKGFNFSLFFFKTHFMMLLTNPRNALYHIRVVIRQYPMRLILGKLSKTIKAAFNKEEVSSRYFDQAMNSQSQNIP